MPTLDRHTLQQNIRDIVQRWPVEAAGVVESAIRPIWVVTAGRGTRRSGAGMLWATLVYEQ